MSINSVLRLRNFCFVEWVTNDVKYGLIGRPLYFPYLRAHPPYPQIPSHKSNYLRRRTTVKENPIRQWVLKTFPYYAKRNPVRVKGAERYYRHPADVWVDRYIQLIDDGKSDEQVKFIITSEVERERREYEIEQTVQIEQAGELGVPWASLDQKLRASAAPAIKHFAREKQKIETVRREILRNRAQELLGYSIDRFGGTTIESEEEDVEADAEADQTEATDGTSTNAFNDDDSEELAEYVSDDQSPSLRTLRDVDKLDYPDLPPGITQRELKTFFQKYPELKGAFKFSDNIEDPYRIQMFSLGNTIDPFAWPTHLQEELLDKVGKSESLDEAETHFENVLEKVDDARKHSPESFKDTPTDFQFPPGFRESEAYTASDVAFSIVPTSEMSQMEDDFDDTDFVGIDEPSDDSESDGESTEDTKGGTDEDADVLDVLKDLRKLRNPKNSDN